MPIAERLRRATGRNSAGFERRRLCKSAVAYTFHWPYDAAMPTTSHCMAARVDVNDDTICVELTDGRTISVPAAWYPRLSHGTSEERNNWRLIGSGRGIHWPDLDEDVSVENLLAGKPSAESQPSFKRWLLVAGGFVEHLPAGAA